MYNYKCQRLYFTEIHFSRFLLEFQNFPLVESISREFPISPILFASFFDFHHCECAAYSCAWGQSSFRSFLLNPSKRTNGLKGNQKDETPSFANAVCVVCLYRSYIRGCRFFAPVSFRHFAFSAQPLDVEKYTGVEERKKERKRQSGKGGRKKQTKAPFDLGSGFATCRGMSRHTYPLVLCPLRNITILWSLLHSKTMIVSNARF